MNKKRFSFAGVLSLLSLSMLSAADGEIKQEDVDALREWINSKRMVTVKELGGELSFAGDIHAEMQRAYEKKNGVKQRGNQLNIPAQTYDMEFNFSVDYRTDRSWAAARLRFDNDMGVTTEPVGSGKTNGIKVDRAYIGYRLVDGDQHTFDVELGRRPLSFVLDSRIQFGSNCDGVIFKDNYAFDKAGDFYYQLGSMVVNEKHSQLAYFAELGLLNIGRSGLYVKYSLLDWDTHNASGIPYQFDFIVSQAILGYKFIPVKFDRLIHFYLSGLYNTRASRLPISNYQRANWGGYGGFSIGQIKRKGDWSFDANYQFVGAQAIPNFDSLGIGLGSNSNASFYYTKEKDTTKINSRSTAEGNVNFKGFELTFQYLLSNNLNIYQQYKQAQNWNKNIGPRKSFKQYEVDFIYTF